MQLLENVYGTKNKIKILRHLYKHKNWEFNITELSRDLNINKGITSRIVNDLEENNIVTINRKGNILLFRLNKSSKLVNRLVIPVFEEESRFYKNILKRLVRKIKSKNVKSIIVYGSVAADKARPTSDIDVLIIVIRESTNLEKGIKEVTSNLVKEDLLLHVDIMTIKEFRKGYKENEPLIKSILKNNKVIYGKNISELMK
jgi:predicted nucleotidyltransferase